jgi:site-specific DNA-methyltransferase (adenine-specific)
MRAGTQRTTGGGYNGFGPNAVHADTYADSGGASRFFPQFYYAAKSPSRERHAGCHDLFWERDDDNLFGYRRVSRERYATLPADKRALGNAHTTVKSIGTRERPGIARWLVRLITPPGGRVCDVTCGSGSIPIAAHLEGFDAVGMDICPEAITIAQHRAAYWEAEALGAARKQEEHR